MRYRIIPVTDLEQNCSLVWCEQTLRGALIDPGGDAEILLAAARAEGVTLEKLLLTHGHLDHVGAAGELAAALGIPVEGPQRADAFWLDSLPQQAQWLGMSVGEPLAQPRWLEQGDKVRVGNVEFEVLHCPGHTPGHVVFFQRAARVAFVGDVLFRGSIGRTDLPRGDYAALIASIRDRLLPLGDEVEFVPGHGPTSTLGHELRSNPFLR
jgi:glyoxylase-like metal-dependent hydrolase (beta-lactamase superfamily II)